MRSTNSKDGHNRLVATKPSKESMEGRLRGYAKILKYGRSEHADKVWHDRSYEKICASYRETLAKRGAQNGNDVTVTD